MNNESMNGVRPTTTIRQLQDLSQTLMRDLTEKEIETLATSGIYYFIHEVLGMNDAEYSALDKTRKIISAYCTKSQADFDKELEGDITIPYYALKTIINAMEDKMKSTETTKQEDKCTWGTFPINETAESDVKQDDSNTTKAEELCNLLNKIPESTKNWLECYVKLVKDHKTVLNVLKSGQCPQTEDERIGDVVDAIKDAVIDACVEKLKAEGEIELDPEIMSEVTAKIWHSEDNVIINIVNNKLKVEFK